MLIDIDRLQIAVYGVSSDIVEEAVGGLEAEFQRRLGVRRGMPPTAAAELRLGRLDLPARADAAAVRALLAERLLEALVPAPGTARSGGD